MKYTPGRYSVTFFCAIGTKIHTIWSDNDLKPFMTLGHAQDYANEDIRHNSAASYAIERVIQNSAVEQGNH